MSGCPSARSIPTEYVEVCFPAWPARRSAVRMLGRWAERVTAARWDAALFLVALVAVPGVIAAVSLLLVTFFVAFVLLAPAVAVSLAYLAWRRDRRRSNPPVVRRLHCVPAPG